MRIGVYLGDGLPDPTSGGGFTFQSSILSALQKASSNHEFIIFYKGSNPGYRSDNPLIFLVPLQKYYSHRDDFLLKKAFLKIMRVGEFFVTTKRHASLLNKAAHDYSIDLIWFMTPSYELVEIPFVYTVWDLQHRRQSYFPEVSVTGSRFEEREKHYNAIIPRATYVIAGNETGKQEIIKFYGMPEERVKTLELPTPSFVLNPPATHGDVIKKYQLTSPYLFYPAQFWPHKNHMIIVQALKLLNDESKNSFSVVFTGSDKGNLRYIKDQVKELGLQNDVHFLGFVSLTELVDLYRNAFALVFASFFGPNNIPPLEAFALGCPVIAACAAGVDEQLGDAALLFDPKNVYELAALIKKLHDDKNLGNMLIERGKQRALRWTSDDYVQGVISIIDEFAPIRRCWSSKEKYVHL